MVKNFTFLNVFVIIVFSVSRVKDLLKSGVLKEKPMWYDVVVAFPPIVEADLVKQPDPENVGRITHSEDSPNR